MFYAHFVLSKKGPLARIWLAAHWDKKLTRAHVFETNISSSVEAILEPKLKMALRTSGHLLLGVVRIYSRKAKYLLADCNEAFVKIKMAFRPGVVDLPDEANREAAIAAITLPENIHEFETTIADLNELNMNTIAINQSRPEDITMRDDFGEINLGRQDDDFGDSTFDDMSGRDVARDDDGNFSDALYNRGSDKLSIKRSSELGDSAHGDNTLIADSYNQDKADKRSGEMLIDDDDDGDEDIGQTFFGGGDDDSEGDFGGAISSELFSDAAIFEDPSGQKQLEHITSEIVSHMEITDLNQPTGVTPKPVSGEVTATATAQANGPVIAKEATGDEEPTETSANGLNEPELPLTTVVTAADTTTLTPAVPNISLTASNTTLTRSTRDNTTLLSNESGAFALAPIDASSISGLEIKRGGKRRRRLVIDEQKSIPSEVMKIQMQDTSDITTQLDLAPPTKKLMHWKETGSVDRLLSLPGRAIPSRALLRLFTRNLVTLVMPDDTPEEQSSMQRTAQQLAIATSAVDSSTLSGARTPRVSVSSSSEMQQFIR